MSLLERGRRSLSSIFFWNSREKYGSGYGGRVAGHEIDLGGCVYLAPVCQLAGRHQEGLMVCSQRKSSKRCTSSQRRLHELGAPRLEWFSVVYSFEKEQQYRWAQGPTVKSPQLSARSLCGGGVCSMLSGLRPGNCRIVRDLNRGAQEFFFLSVPRFQASVRIVSEFVVACRVAR